ncbi:MAG TPA: aldehyde dehydrogenase (NADP(+)) [Pyrinomonadaceae bacterium]
MELTGRSIIGFKRGESNVGSLQGFNPATGEKLEPSYHFASTAEVDAAAQLAAQAFSSFSQTSGTQRARFLRRIAENIEALGDTLITRATQESGLAEGRIRTETGRTCAQLRLFANLIEEGSWVDARIDHADPNRAPVPKPDVRSMLRPLGPVVVFGASNFPLAFSVAGGDTASAFAAGNPVIVKAHHAHPGTSELVGLAVSNAVREGELHEGVFSMLYGSGNEIGVALVKHPLIKAGGFTGSRSGGRALFDAASSRPEPIPFYAEMSSVNPVVILPEALRTRTEQLATGMQGSVTLGAGQFCTNPGLVFLQAGPEADAFATRLGELLSGSAEQTMLTSGIRSSYQNGVSTRFEQTGVVTVMKKTAEAGCGAAPALFKVEAANFLTNASLSEEIFGPTTLIVTYADREELLQLVHSLEGQLTATIHGTDEELSTNHDLINALEQKAGRLLFNGYPTGVEVCHAMVHGGPYPATSDGRSTSVGTRAIFRFTRQVCYQSFPDAALPDELKEENSLGIWRLVDGELKK